MNREELIEFAMYLTGHDRETIEQMYEDWSGSETMKSPWISVDDRERFKYYARDFVINKTCYQGGSRAAFLHGVLWAYEFLKNQA